MKSFFRTAALAIALLAAAAAPLFALSDAEYKKMMKNSEFAKADRALTNAWNKVKKTFPDTKEGRAAYKLLLDDQREWIKNWRDSEAQDLMDMEGYSRIKAYAVATKTRAEYLPELARTFLKKDAAPKKGGETPKKDTPKPKKDEPKPKPKPKPKASIDGYPTETARRIAAGDWTDSYPETGNCVGSGVRIREDPDMEADNILGKLNDGEMVLVIGETSVDDAKWYEIDNPHAEGSAWVSADYIETYKGYETDTPAYETLVQVMLNFGLTPDKTRILLGEPDRELVNDTFSEPANRNIHQDIFQYNNGVDLRYNDGRLSYVRVYEPGMPFGEIQIGDSTSKLMDVLGEPTQKDGASWRYEGTPLMLFTFVANDRGKIVELLLEEYID